MKKTILITAVLLGFLIAINQAVPAQFPIKIPKIGKPKIEQPKSEQPKTEILTTDENPVSPGNAKASGNRPSQTDYLSDPESSTTPQFLLETLEIKVHNEARYAKYPKQNDYTSWIPQVSFEVMYAAGSPKLRYLAEWFNPDGSLWFSEPLEMNNSGDFPVLRSPYESVDINPKAIIDVGNYGLKLSDTKTSQTVFQGKFTVKKILLEPSLKNKNLFYVENDWHLPIGYVGFAKNHTDYEIHTRPRAFFWFKGIPDTNQFEGELYLNNQRVATTDKGGNINKLAERGEKCYLARDLCAHSLISFEWENFLLDNAPSARQNNPNGYFTNDHPGEYTVKIYYNGDQVREAKFTIDQKGRIARNAFSEQVYLKDHRVIVPVKILGMADKYTAASWKTDLYYGNLLKGFAAP